MVRARGLMSQRLSRFIAFVHYFDKSFTTVIGVPVGIASAKHNRIVMLAWSKLNRKEKKISEALINNKLVMKFLWKILTKKKTNDN